jgi:hypothetical protein
MIMIDHDHDDHNNIEETKNKVHAFLFCYMLVIQRMITFLMKRRIIKLIEWSKTQFILKKQRLLDKLRAENQ